MNFRDRRGHLFCILVVSIRSNSVGGAWGTKPKELGRLRDEWQGKLPISPVPQTAGAKDRVIGVGSYSGQKLPQLSGEYACTAESAALEVVSPLTQSPSQPGVIRVDARETDLCF